MNKKISELIAEPFRTIGENIYKNYKVEIKEFKPEIDRSELKDIKKWAYAQKQPIEVYEYYSKKDWVIGLVLQYKNKIVIVRIPTMGCMPPEMEKFLDTKNLSDSLKWNMMGYNYDYELIFDTIINLVNKRIKK